MTNQYVVTHLQSVFEQAGKEEIERFYKKMTTEQREKIEHITQNIINEIMKLPFHQLSAAELKGESDTQAQLLYRLFSRDC